MTPRTIAAIKLTITMFIVALVTVYAKETLNNVRAIDFIWLQMLFAVISICLFTFLFKKKTIPQNIPKKAWLVVVFIGLTNFTFSKTLFVIGLKIMPVTTHAYLMNFVGIITMLFSAILLREIPSKMQLLGALIALVGIQVYFQVLPNSEQLYGVFILLVAVVFLVATNLLMRVIHLEYPDLIAPSVVTTVAIISGGLPLIIYGLFDTQYLSAIGLYDWSIIIANGVIGISLVMNVFNIVMKELRAYETSILATTGLIFTALLSIPILDDVIKTNEILGITLLFLGIIFVQFFQPQKT